MKQLVTAFLLLVGLFNCPQLIAETVFLADGNHYQISDDYTYAILVCPESPGATNSNGNIPEKVAFEGKYYPVKRIGSNAFKGNSNLLSTIIPESVVYIGENAFQGCTKLQNVKIEGDSIRRIGTAAFAQCVSLSEIDLPSSIVSIGSRAFKDCINLTEVQWPCNVCVIEPEVFSHCKNLTNPKLHPSIQKVGSSAFYGCSSLSVLPIFEQLDEIGKNAFSLCESLETISIFGPTEIGEGAFSGCKNLYEVELGEKIKTISFSAFVPCEKLDTVKCAATSLPDANAFSFSSENATLFVPEESISKYQDCRPWSSFKKIEKLPVVTEIIIVYD